MRRNILLVPVLALASASAVGAQLSGACQPVFAAMEKTMRADHATSTTRAGESLHGITVGGVNYLQMQGVWKKSPMSVQDNIDRSHENLKNATEYSCKPLPDSTVNGVAVANYATHTVGGAVIDNTISIDRRTGLAVTVTTDIKDSGSHVVTQYSYSGIKAPI
jgi:hypothetical protein